MWFGDNISLSEQWKKTFFFPDISSSETVDFKVIYNKQKFDVSMQVDSTISALKFKVQGLTGMM